MPNFKMCYNFLMYNWSVDETKISKNPEKYAIWKLEQMINYGLNGAKINEAELRRYWNKLTIDPQRRKFLELILGKGEKNTL